MSKPPSKPPSKVTRYRPGKVPAYAIEATNEEVKVKTREKIVEARPRPPNRAITVAQIVSEGVADPKPLASDQKKHPIQRKEDESEDEVSTDSDQDVILPDNLDEQSDEELERRRDELRDRLRKQRQAQKEEEQELLDRQDEEEGEGDAQKESSSEYETETESEDDIFPTRPKLLPQFIPRTERQTLLQNEQFDEEEENLRKQEEQRKEEKKKESRQLVVEEIKKELEAKTKAESDSEAEANPEEEEDEAQSYEKWKQRELARIRREKEEREGPEKERLDIERRRLMTDEEIRNEDKERFKPKKKTKYKFLQKYYHQGVFFQHTEDQIYTRDYSEPTLEDKFDKTILPKVMQVKNFGRSGRTKWTHLTDQDTTDFTGAWSKDTPINRKTANKGGGMGPITGPPAKKQKSE